MALRIRPRRLGALILALTVLPLAGCGSDDGRGTASPRSSGPVVVAASTWEGAFAKAAGARDVRVIVPPSIKHAPDYDPKPSDLAAVADARYLLYAPFEGFAGKLKDAAGSSAEQVSLNLDNSKTNVEKEVRRLAAMFGTRQAAEKWIGRFDAQYDRLSAAVRAAWPDRRQPRVITQVFMSFAAQLSGARVLGTYGPQPVTASQLAKLSAAKPPYVFDNEQMSTGTVLPGSSAKQLALTNYPGPGLDLLAVYRADANTIIRAFRG
jgi:zinc transport system substrate-binding protein